MERLSRADRMRRVFGAARALIGMLHLDALPGTPREAGGAGAGTVEAAIVRAIAEARIYRDAGFTAIAIENMHDRPYLKRSVGPEIVAAMAAVGQAVKRAVDPPPGVQVLARAHRQAR